MMDCHVFLESRFVWFEQRVTGEMWGFEKRCPFLLRSEGSACGVLPKARELCGPGVYPTILRSEMSKPALMH